MLDNLAIRTPSAPGKAHDGSIRIAAIQMAAGPNVSGNLEEAARLLDMAASQGAKLAALPEYFCIMGMQDADKVAAREQEAAFPSSYQQHDARHDAPSRRGFSM